MAEILHWIDGWLPSPEPGMVAVDAPTLIANPRGMRPCDRQSHRYFGRYHAGCYPANLARPFAPRTLGLGLRLEDRGFSHAPRIQPQVAGRYQIEVFPHAATVMLFNLSQIVKYKKGRLAERRQGLQRLRQLMLAHLPQAEPPLIGLQLPEVPMGGAALKALEDQLDALLCAYVAAHWWVWGATRNWVLGGQESEGGMLPGPLQDESVGWMGGYIVVPQGGADPRPRLR
jgi:predicted RNase H-like nuclease